MNIFNLLVHHYLEKDELFNFSDLIKEIIENIIIKIYLKFYQEFILMEEKI